MPQRLWLRKAERSGLLGVWLSSYRGQASRASHFKHIAFGDWLAHAEVQPWFCVFVTAKEQKWRARQHFFLLTSRKVVISFVYSVQ